VYLKDTRKRDKRLIIWTPEAEAAFEQYKEKLANAAVLAHPSDSAKIRLVTDASNIAMGAVIEQANNASWQSLAFFSRKFMPSQLKYSTFDRELTTIYEAIRHFRYLLEGHEFTIHTDHKPLIYAFIKNSDQSSPRQSRLL